MRTFLAIFCVVGAVAGSAGATTIGDLMRESVELECSGELADFERQFPDFWALDFYRSELATEQFDSLSQEAISFETFAQIMSALSGAGIAHMSLIGEEGIRDVERFAWSEGLQPGSLTPGQRAFPGQQQGVPGD